MSLAAPPLPERVGWCPGVLRPMRAGDGLLVRVKPRGNRLAPAALGAVATLAERYGNGALTLTARANLQLRGVAECGLARLTDELGALGLIDAAPEAEAVRNVVTSPFATRGDGVDGAACALEDRLTADPALRQLPAKFGWVVDGPGPLALGPLGADVHVTANADGSCLLRLADSGLAARITSGDLPDAAARLADAFLRLCPAHGLDPHRMRDLLALCGAGAVLERAGLAQVETVELQAVEAPIGPYRRGGAAGVAVAFPFGLVTAAVLGRVAAFASSRFPTADADIRLTSWRTLLLPGVPDAAELAGSGAILDGADRRLRIAACVGAPGCERASTAVPADASRIAAALPLRGQGVQLHVSGCTKGCACAAPAPVTLVGSGGGYDLVLRGRAGDPPLRTRLRPEALATMLPALLSDLCA